MVKEEGGKKQDADAEAVAALMRGVLLVVEQCVFGGEAVSCVLSGVRVCVEGMLPAMNNKGGGENVLHVSIRILVRVCIEIIHRLLVSVYAQVFAQGAHCSGMDTVDIISVNEQTCVNNMLV